MRLPPPYRQEQDAGRQGVMRRLRHWGEIHSQIQAKVAALGKQIKRDYKGKYLLLLGTLKGAVPFIADLARAIDLPLEIDYMAISSYGNTTHSSGVVRILKDLEGPIDQKHVLIVEDIVDSGLTLHYQMDVLRQRHPLSLRVCALLDKDRERIKVVNLDYTGFQIPNRRCSIHIFHVPIRCKSKHYFQLKYR